MYKLLALDMDDTVLDENKVLTVPVISALQKLIFNNIHVTLASGRFPASLWLHAKYIGIKTPLVALNGGALVDPVTAEAIQYNRIDLDVAYRLAKTIKEAGSYIQFYGYNILFVEELNDENRMWPLKNVVINPDIELTFGNYRNQAYYIKVKPVGNILSFLRNTKDLILKATVLDDNIENIDKLYKELLTWSELTITRTGEKRFDINAEGISKKIGLEEICKKKKIKAEEVVAVGDYDNDIEMIKWAGLGVAMGNGNKNIKKIANYITKSNSNDGVAYLIRKKILSY